MNEIKKAAIVRALVDGLGKGGWIGKTHVQKAVLFAQEAAGIDLGFRYVIHHYGPYSFELANFLESLNREGILKISKAADGYGYQVSPGETPAEETPDAQKIELLAKELGGKTASDMELLATSFYVRRRYGDDASNVAKIRELKPRFSDDDVKKALIRVEEISAALTV